MKKINVTVCGTLLFTLAITCILILAKDKQYIKESSVQVEALTNEENYPNDKCTPSREYVYIKQRITANTSSQEQT